MMTQDEFRAKLESADPAGYIDRLYNTYVQDEVTLPESLVSQIEPAPENAGFYDRRWPRVERAHAGLCSMFAKTLAKACVANQDSVSAKLALVRVFQILNGCEFYSRRIWDQSGTCMCSVAEDLAWDAQDLDLGLAERFKHEARCRNAPSRYPPQIDCERKPTRAPEEQVVYELHYLPEQCKRFLPEEPAEA